MGPDTRRPTVRFPDENYKDWSRHIMNMLKKRGVIENEMEYLEVRLNHAAFITPLKPKLPKQDHKDKGPNNTN